MFTGLLGNLSLLSYFIKKRETEAVVVQTLGVVSTYVVITQLAMAGSMPLPQYSATSVVVFTGLVVNFMNYFYLLNPGIWRLWEDFITIVGLSALPQVNSLPVKQAGNLQVLFEVKVINISSFCLPTNLIAGHVVYIHSISSQ